MLIIASAYSSISSKCFTKYLNFDGNRRFSLVDDEIERKLVKSSKCKIIIIKGTRLDIQIARIDLNNLGLEREIAS